MKRTQGATNREIPVSKTLPYGSHVTPTVVTTRGGDLVAVYRVAGIAHECADVENLDGWHRRLNGLMKTIQSSKLTLWSHVVRQRRQEYPEGDFRPGSFAAQLNQRYRERVTNVTMMVNDLYLAVVYSRHEHKAKRLLARFEKRSAEEVRGELDDALEALEDVCRTVESGLGDFRPRRLGWYERDGIMFSEMLEFFGFLVNGEWQRWPVPRLRPGEDMDVGDLLATARPFFGREAFELRGATQSRVGAVLALKEYPPATAPGFTNKLLSLPFEFLLSQSFRFIPKQNGLQMLTIQQNKMVKSGDVAVSQITEMNDALDALASGQFAMGEHHLSLTVLADNLKDLNENIALARTNLSDCGAVPVREDWGMEAAFWAQLPGNFRFRPRPAPITSLNFAGFSSLHNMPSGLATGNQWGPAVALLQTSSGAPYYFNFHVPPKSRGKTTASSRSAAADLEIPPDDRVPGNTLIIGPTGSGKTVIQTFLLSQLEKFEPTVFYYDKDRGMEIFIRAVGGTYLTIRNGVPTGFNPFKLPKSPANVAFLQTFVRTLLRADGHPISTREEADLDNGIEGVLGLPEGQRRLGRLWDFLDVSDMNGVAARLKRWMRGSSRGWVFDNDEDQIDPGKYRVNGFDITDLLDNDEVREPVLMYLLHRQEEVMDGRRVVIGFDEGWKVLRDKQLSVYLLNKEKTIRKQNGFVVFGSQSPTDVLASGIAETLVEQSVTQIYLPNLKASEEDYIDGFKLTRREFELVSREMAELPGRFFLVKQGAQAAVCELNLGGLDDELAVLSGTTGTVELLTKIMAEVGHDPAAWLPVFQQRRRL